MQPFALIPPLNARVWAAWQTQFAAAVKTPGLLPELMRRRHELLPRFAAYYTQLRALPRRVRRVLQRRWGASLASLALWLALGQSPVQAATINVSASCTLVNAITAANTDTATGGCPAGSEADTIVLPVGSTHTLTSSNNDTYGPTGLPVISSVITIEGQGSTIARGSEAPEFRIFAVSSIGELTLQETTVSGGIAPTGGFRSYRGGHGGGVANFGGTLAIINSTISGNVAVPYIVRGRYGRDSFGGGVDNGGTLTVIDSTISGNSAYNGGGGVTNSGTLTITNSTIAGNSAYYGGGGVVNFLDGTLTITNSTISGNLGGYPGASSGGIDNRGILTITNSTISGNSAFLGIGGVGNSNEGTLIITNSTISGNSGSGVSNIGTLTLARTLVSGNTAPTEPEIQHNSYFGGTVLTDSHNLFGLNGNAGIEGFSPGPTDVVPGAGVLLSDILDPLVNNGGPTRTHALVPGSPAIDAAGPGCTDANGAFLTTDQRGKPRPVDGNGDGMAACDIGAFEFFPIVNDFVALDPALGTSFDAIPGPEAPAGTFTLTATFTNTSPTPLRFPFFRVTELSGGNLLLNADSGAAGVGATLTPHLDDQVLSPGESITVDFVIGLQQRERFTLFVDLFGEPIRNGDTRS